MSNFPYEKLTFFLGKLYQKFFLFFLKIDAENIREYVEFSVWKTNFFPRQAIPKILFVLQSSYPWDTRCRVWFDLDNSLIRLKRRIFKISYSQTTQISECERNFFTRQALPKNLLFYALITQGILHTKFGLIWTTPWPDKISIFLKIEKANNKGISRYWNLPIEIRTLFLG